MTIEDIIDSVRYCIDENTDTASVFTTEDYTTMDNIIKNKIGDAVRWICLYGPADLLGGSDEVDGNDEPIDTGILVDAELSNNVTEDNGVSVSEGEDCLVLTMPTNFIKIARVRMLGWHRAKKQLISEDSEEYLQLYDSNGATATADRPQAALREKSVRQIELWPSGASESYLIEVTFVADTDPVEITQGDPATVVGYALPPKAKTAFIYYLAFLLLSAYGDERCTRMLEIAKMNLGLTSK